MKKCSAEFQRTADRYAGVEGRVQDKGKKKKKLDIPVDFETLQKENPDIYAWITIPGTDIDYPVVQDSTDNTYYLNHAADTSLSDSGAI